MRVWGGAEIASQDDLTPAASAGEYPDALASRALAHSQDAVSQSQSWMSGDIPAAWVHPGRDAKTHTSVCCE